MIVKLTKTLDYKKSIFIGIYLSTPIVVFLETGEYSLVERSRRKVERSRRKWVLTKKSMFPSPDSAIAFCEDRTPCDLGNYAFCKTDACTISIIDEIRRGTVIAGSL